MNCLYVCIIILHMEYYRYLASGDSMISMSYHLVEVTTANNIILETCTAIWDCLSPVVLPGKFKKKTGWI